MDPTCFCLLNIAVAVAQEIVFPTKIIYDSMPVSVNGSSESGFCLNVMASQCLEPTTSVLYDGMIPMLELDQNLWADQLLILNNSQARITFDFSERSHYVGVKGLEVILFNCLQWGRQVQSIKLLERNGSSGSRRFNTEFIIEPFTNSCSHLIIVGQQVNLLSTQLSLFFTANSWLSLAEVTFYSEYNQTSIDTIYNPATPSTTPAIDISTTPLIDNSTTALLTKSHETVPTVFEFTISSIPIVTITIVTTVSGLLITTVSVLIVALVGLCKIYKKRQTKSQDINVTEYEEVNPDLSPDYEEISDLKIAAQNTEMATRQSPSETTASEVEPSSRSSFEITQCSAYGVLNKAN